MAYADAVAAIEMSERISKQTRGMPGATAVVTPVDIRIDVHDCRPSDDFEIGSISKGVTGLLYADAHHRGEVRPETTLGELLPLADSPAAGITLTALASHRSGVPRTIGGQVIRRTLAYYRHGADPYDQPLSEFYADARAAQLKKPGRARYSNAGFQLLGHALAAAARCSYAELVRVRLAEPLGLSPFYVPRSAADLLPTSVHGHRRQREVSPWASDAVGPAGGVRASIEAMATFAKALLNSTAPGMAALDPVADFAGPAVRIGAGWIVTDRRARGVLTWHNGGTGGFRSWLGLRRDAGVAVVVLGASTRSVDSLGLALLDEAAAG